MRRSHRKRCWYGIQKKYRYPREKEALKEMRYEQSLGVNVKGVYRCPYCKDWHLTSEEPK